MGFVTRKRGKSQKHRYRRHHLVTVTQQKCFSIEISTTLGVEFFSNVLQTSAHDRNTLWSDEGPWSPEPYHLTDR